MKIFIFYILAFLITVIPVRAEEYLPPGWGQSEKESFSLRGKTQVQVEEIYGKPDKVSQNVNSSQEIWDYGKAKVFFIDGKVTASTEDNELKLRRDNVQVTKPLKTQGEPSSLMNNWTAESSDMRDEMLDELLK